LIRGGFRRSLLAGQRVLNSGPGIGPALPMIPNDATPILHLLPLLVTAKTVG
jgi:hypothetical protein